MSFCTTVLKTTRSHLNHQFGTLKKMVFFCRKRKEGTEKGNQTLTSLSERERARLANAMKEKRKIKMSSKETDTVRRGGSGHWR